MDSLLLRGIGQIRASVTLDNIDLSNSETGASWPSGGRVALAGGEWATYEVLYRTQPYIRAAVNRIARGIGRIPMAAYTDTVGENGLADRERLRSGPLAELLRNPWPGKTATHFKQATMHQALTQGYAIFVKWRGRVQDPPRYLLPSRPERWYVPRDAFDDLDQPRVYVYREPNGREVPFQADEVVVFSPYTSRKSGLGESPLEALRTTLLGENAAQRATIAAFEKGMRPSGVFAFQGEMKPDAMKRTRADIEERYGGVDNYFRFVILDQAASYTPIDVVALDPSLLQLRRFNREEVAAVYNVPPPAIAVLDEQKYANIREQHLMEYQDTFQPWTTLLEETLAVQLIEREAAFEGAYVEFNFKEVLRGDPIREMETLVKGAGRPFLTLNEARATQNLSPFSEDEDPTADRVPFPLNSGAGRAQTGFAESPADDEP